MPLVPCLRECYREPLGASPRPTTRARALRTAVGGAHRERRRHTSTPDLERHQEARRHGLPGPPAAGSWSLADGRLQCPTTRPRQGRSAPPAGTPRSRPPPRCTTLTRSPCAAGSPPGSIHGYRIGDRLIKVDLDEIDAKDDDSRSTERRRAGGGARQDRAMSPPGRETPGGLRAVIPPGDRRDLSDEPTLALTDGRDPRGAPHDR